MRKMIPYVEWVQASDDHQHYVGIRRLAAMVNISPSTAYRMLKSGRLLPPVGRIGQGARLRFRREDVIAWAQAGFPGAARWAELQRTERAGASRPTFADDSESDDDTAGRPIDFDADDAPPMFQ